MSEWDTYSEEKKHLAITNLIVDCAKSLSENNPVLAILTPNGTKDDVEALWNGELNQIVNDESIFDEANPNHKFYFPQISETDQVPYPTLYKRVHQEDALLRNYFSEKLKASGVDGNSLLPVSLTLEALRSFYLVSEVLIPSIVNKANIITPSGLILPR